MRHVILAAAAALALAGCDQLGGGNGPALPRLQEGAVAPSTQAPQPGARQATNIDDATRQALLQNIDEMLDAMQNQSGMAPAAGVNDQIAPMQPGTDNRNVVTLNSGGYTIVGACDGDCTNMDIELIDMATGGVVASDMLPDDFPVVNYNVPANGQYMVRMLMQACSVAPCYGGARVLSAGAVVPPPAAQPAADTSGGGAKP